MAVFYLIKCFLYIINVVKIIAERILNRKEREIKSVLSGYSNPVVSCSYGKDSILVIWLLRRLGIKFSSIFSNTGFEYPDTYKFKRYIEQLWNFKSIEVPPKKSFWQIVEKYGFPIYSKGNPKKWSRKYLPAKYCCLYLKSRPLTQYLRKSNFDIIIDGIRGSESYMRRYSLKRTGKLYFNKGSKKMRWHIISEITEDELDILYNHYKIPYCGLYDKKIEGLRIRTGCWCCTLNLRYPKIKFLRTYYPKLWRLILQKGLSKKIIELKIGREVGPKTALDFIEKRPCFFDSL